MKYLIETKHGKDPATITRAMNYEDASDLYEGLTGYEAPAHLAPGETERYGRTILREATLPELVTVDKDGSKNFDFLIEDFSEERKDIARKRAARIMGYDAEISDEDEEFDDCYYKQLIFLALDDLLEQLISAGRVHRTGIDSSGNVIYETTDPNEQLAEIL